MDSNNRVIDHNGVRRLAKQGGQVVDALPAADFANSHLPGAINIPVADLPAGAAGLDRSLPVIVYCHDAQ
ncbi:MAG TPA: rhodanese-like domain-containing protein [Dehalococcoidia bacterium]|nr:rhodanese-like domain-containing protein [Dehalococcoidia bacterium]